MLDKIKLYKYHQENILIIETAIQSTKDNLKNAIIQQYVNKNIVESEKKARNNILIQTRILSGLIVCWSEEIIKRLFYEANAFTDLQIEKLHDQNLQQKWELALKISFCKAYKVKNPNNSPLYSGIDIEQQLNVSRTAKDRYKNIMNLISLELIPAIDIRNKVQHGEWIKAFEPPNSLNFSPDMTREVNRENIIIQQTKINQFKAIYQLIHDLAVFKIGNNAKTFERDFDTNYNKIESNRYLLKIRKFSDYKNDIIKRYENGIIWKKKNTKFGILSKFINKIT